jgi:hypothetical protein
MLGRFSEMEIRRFASAGAFLAPKGAATDAATLLLPGAEIPPGAREGDELHVFVTLDSEGRPLATTAQPRLALGEVAFLRVSACTEFGAFVDWGLPKELLVPFAEQTAKLHVGDRHPIGLYLDSSGRLAGTMHINDVLRAKSNFTRGEWVEGEAWRDDPAIGLFVIVARRFLGLVPRYEPHGLARGEAARFRVAHVHPDGKLELSLRGPAHQEMENDARRILQVLQRPGAPRVGDHTSPEQIRSLFGLSRKAFKRAAGRLLRERLVDVDEEGHLRASRAAGRGRSHQG